MTHGKKIKLNTIAQCTLNGNYNQILFNLINYDIFHQLLAFSIS